MPALRPGVHSTPPGGSSAVSDTARCSLHKRRSPAGAARRWSTPSTSLSAEAALPAASQARLRQLVPFSLEELLADDVDQMVFAIGARLPSGATQIAAVARKRMDAWLAELRAAGIEPHAMCSEADGIPDIPATLVLIIEGERIAGRKPGQAPFVFDGLALSSGSVARARAQTRRAGAASRSRVHRRYGPWPFRRRARVARRAVRERRREDSERRRVPAFRGHARATHGDQPAARRLRA